MFDSITPESARGPGGLYIIKCGASMHASPSTARPIYMPTRFTISSISDLSPTEKLFRLDFPPGSAFDFRPGQFIQVSVAGYGEAPFSISNSPTRNGYLELGIRNAGRLTGAMHNLKPGAVIGVRGPFGSSFNIGRLRGKDLILIAGGCGLAPLRSLIQYCEDRRSEFNRVTVLYGAKTPDDLLYKNDLAVWEHSDSLQCMTTVDGVPDGEDYSGRIGLITLLIPPLEIDPGRTEAVIIGPPAMYRYVIEELKRKGLAESQMTVSLERHMKCGVGKCGHCAIEHLYCCIDGPVFNLTEVIQLQGAL